MDDSMLPISALTTAASLCDDAIMFSDIPQTLFRIDQGALRIGEKPDRIFVETFTFPATPECNFHTSYRLNIALG